MPTGAAPALCDDALVEVLSLIKGADSVELEACAAATPTSAVRPVPEEKP
jgi:hypothetical protein